MGTFSSYSDSRLEDALATWSYVERNSQIPSQAQRAARMMREINAEMARRQGLWSSAVLSAGPL